MDSINLQGSYKGITLRDISRLYTSKNNFVEQHHIKDYYVLPEEYKTIHDGKVFVPYVKEKNEKNKRTYFNMVIAHSKSVPDPGKYAKLTHWPGKGRSALPQGAKVTLFAEVAKKSRKMPGPTSYNAASSLDKAVLPKTLGTYKSNLKKMSTIELESFAKKDIPGPLHKYNINHKHVEPKVPIKVNFNKTMGRDNKLIPNQTAPAAPVTLRIQKDKTAGPGTYDVEKGMKKISHINKVTNVTSVSGMSLLEGQKPNLMHVDKIKIKSERSFET